MKENYGSAPGRRRGLSALLWVAQLLVAAMFVVAGGPKVFSPADELTVALSWDGPLALIRFIGLSELLGAAGLLLPALTRIRPGLTPLAAFGAFTVMLMAIGFHLGRDEYAQVTAPLVLALAAALVWWGRTRWLPIRARGVGGQNVNRAALAGTSEGAGTYAR